MFAMDGALLGSTRWHVDPCPEVVSVLMHRGPASETHSSASLPEPRGPTGEVSQLTSILRRLKQLILKSGTYTNPIYTDTVYPDITAIPPLKPPPPQERWPSFSVETIRTKRNEKLHVSPKYSSYMISFIAYATRIVGPSQRMAGCA